ncbi:DUF418 domain-containing protein [Halobacillus shinanisalinarum]|uniref:DUF418 domain-containing protein n=1 Tax=Halobacillus shinanisalinarum TaxID=2932258 RepID=A0ABY4GXA8_9BACI|nr:DUF418 domain-containing protein [Halobacillus shinanisalinarum]UOQ92800.1 DUF418 domain-containing protein [Halobacillus shinanisalinarum]
MKQHATPLKESDRLNWIDAARGLAILGIFMVNVPAFNAPFFLYGGEEHFWPSLTSDAVQTMIDIFFQASFYTLFSLMFGFGLQMMKDRLDQKGMNYRPVLLRRLAILIGFGLIHSFLIWHGDILLSYGVFGLVLFAFFNRSKRTLLLWAYSLLAILVIPLTLSLYAIRDRLGGFYNLEAINAAKRNYGEGSLLDIWQQNAADWTYANNMGSIPFLAFSLIPMFLFGMYVARERWLYEPDQHLASIKKWWGITGIVFLLFKAGPYFYGNPEWFQLMQDNVGGTASAIFYVLSLTLMSRTSVGRRIINPLRWVGRMSLTNYIFQSLVCFLLFYSVGFGLYGQISPFLSVVIVLVVFTSQVFLSKAWLKKFRFGPLEWLWRTLTYRQKQPLQRSMKGRLK